MESICIGFLEEGCSYWLHPITHWKGFTPVPLLPVDGLTLGSAEGLGLVEAGDALGAVTPVSEPGDLVDESTMPFGFWVTVITTGGVVSDEGDALTGGLALGGG